MAPANERQVGGAHYNKGALQHWDVVHEYKIDYLRGCASKYLLRWREKNGREDVLKALHYLEKWAEITTPLFQTLGAPGDVIRSLCESHGLPDPEARIVYLVMSGGTRGDIRSAIYMVQAMIRHHFPEQTQGTPADGGHHPQEG